MKKNKILVFIKALFSIAFFVVLVSFVRGQELFVAFSHVNWLYFALSFAMVPVLFVLSSLKWKLILDAGERKISFFRLSAIYLVGYFFSNLLPSTVGGDVVRSYYAGKEINNQQYSAVTVFVERFSGLLFLLFLVIFAPLLQPSLYKSLYVIIPTLLSLLFLFIVIWIWLVKEPFALLKSLMAFLLNRLDGLGGRVQSESLGRILTFVVLFLRSLSSRLERFSGELGKALQVIRDNRALLWKIVALTIAFYFFTWLNVFVTFLAFGTKVDFLAIIALVPTIMFVAHFPVTVLGNLGFFESVFVVYFLMVGVSGAETLAMGLLLRLKTLCIGLVGFVVYLFYQQIWGKAPAEEA
jgi:uncharacterized protein (TIRG00374 family)